MSRKITIDLKEIERKKKKLEKVKAELKKEFVGIDYVIEELVDYIQIWYLMPEVLSRPIIVSLWGMTGVGKTDLVRKMVNKLEYQDRFAEVELSNSESSSYYSYRSSVSGILEANGLNDGKPAIVLFDEIQRFNTLDPDGNPYPNVRFQDFWELLSDGKLAKRDDKEEIDRYLEDFLFYSKQRKKQKDQAAATPVPEGEEAAPPSTEDTSIGLWQARQLKKLFSLDDDVQSLADMDQDSVLKKMMVRKTKKKIYEAIDHSKTLIIISGNLDEAFSMASETSEADVDADIFHAYTEKITLVDIKSALSRKFKPEQVARFGNIHLIYKSLRRRDFEVLIQWEVEKVILKNKALFDVQLLVDKHMNELIYQNGVFPVQGVRPVFSSVIDILETNLAKILFEALMIGQNKILIDYDFEGKKIVAKVGKGKIVEIPYVGRVDKIRQANIDDVVANVSVHESGHAVVYGVLLGLAPLQLKSKVASNYVGGFTFPHQIHQTKQTMIDKIKIYLAGGLAEDLVFGEGNATIGRHNDRWEVSNLAMDYIRKYGFVEKYQAYYSNNPTAPMDVFITDKAVEEMIQNLVVETRQILEANKPFLLDLSRQLHTAGSLKANEVAEIAKQYGLDLKIQEESHLHIANYLDILSTEK
jgi:Peptidase family M41/ATPase family associated with various cellular activities (AAA)